VKPATTTGYGDAPLGVECALPGETARLARPVSVRAGIWERMVYRVKYGIKIAPAGHPFRPV